MVFKKIIFQNRYVALETGIDPPPFMANAILNFHFDFLNPSLSQSVYDLKNSLFVESLTLRRYLTSAQKYFRKRQTADMNGNLNVLARTQKELSSSVFSTQ